MYEKSTDQLFEKLCIKDLNGNHLATYLKHSLFFHAWCAAVDNVLDKSSFLRLLDCMIMFFNLAIADLKPKALTET